MPAYTDNRCMKSLFLAGLFAVLACQSQAQNVGVIPANAKIYVDAATGFDTYLAAALKSENVLLAITNQKDTADYELEAMSGARRIPGGSWPTLWGRGDAQSVIRLVDIRTSEIVFVFAMAPGKKVVYEQRTTAEACAKQLKRGMSPEVISPAKHQPEPKDPALNF
jgi:hypothetical protein